MLRVNEIDSINFISLVFVKFWLVEKCWRKDAFALHRLVTLFVTSFITKNDVDWLILSLC